MFNKIQFVYTYEGVRIFTGVILSSPFFFFFFFFFALYVRVKEQVERNK